MPDETTEQQSPALSADDPQSPLLTEIRDRYDYAVAEWKDSREEAQTDMRYLSGDPWDPEDRKQRDDAGRPCINHDELTQYINQAANQVRQNPRGIKIDPAGNGANDQTAEFQQNLIRGIEYRSRAARLAYTPAYENALERSYGWFRISRQYAKDDSFDQNIILKGFPNPDAVLYDPDFQERDGSDALYAFVLNPLPRKEFARKYPHAKKTSFTTEDMRIAGEWIQESTILVAEYWKIVTTQETLTIGQKSRKVEKRKVMQYITNGVEILEESEQPGKNIPIIPVFGKTMWLDDGSGPKRKLISLVRLARDPQMSLAYLNSLEMEGAGLTPKVPYKGYKGQFESDRENIENCTKVPVAFLEFDPMVDGATGTVLPLPIREPFTFDFVSVEAAKESCRRAIQSAMGIMPLPTTAQRQNEKSGIALQKIQQQQAVGSFHFTDNFDCALEYAARIILDWIPVVYDTEREVALRKEDDSHHVVRINTREPVENDKGEPQKFTVEEGDHEPTVSTGPSYDSQREAASDFLDTLIANLKGLPVAPPQAAKLLALAIQMKQLGPKGDQMADIIAPTDDKQNVPPQVQAKMAQMGQQLQQLDALAKQLMQGKEAKTLEYQAKKEIVQIQEQTKVLIEQAKLETQRAIAEIQTKAQDARERAKLDADLDSKLHVSAHERGMQAEEHAQAERQAATQQAHEAQMGEQSHQQALEQGDQSAANQAALAQQTAEQQAAQGGGEGA